MKLQIPTAEVFEPLLQPARYKGAHGGRGSGKSRFFAGLMVEDHLRFPGMRSVCVREVQKTLKDSAKKLLEDRLEEYGLGASQGFRVLTDRIETPGNGMILFQGLADHTAESIKSLEGMNRAWIEEAQTISDRSLQLLRPTIRAPGSEIWASWNPRLKNDPIDRFFRQSNPSNAIVVQSNWRDNPWFPAELDQERRDDLRINPDQYPHVWEGEYVTVQAGAYFASQLTAAKSEHRIGKLARDPLMTIRAFCDIGGTGAKADSFAIWIAQFIGKAIHVIDYYEARGQEITAHVNWLRDKGYNKAQIILPHDGVNHDRVYDITYESEFKRAGFDVPIPVPNQGQGAAMQRIEAARRMFPQIWFNETTCQAGIDALGWYHEKQDEHRMIGLGPEHDWSSHAADAFGMMCLVAENEMNSTISTSKLKYPRLGYS